MVLVQFQEDVTINLDKVYTVVEAAKVVGYDRRHVWLLCETGKIRCRRSGSSYLIDIDSLVQYSYRSGK